MDRSMSEPTPEEILAEAQRRRAQRATRRPSAADRLLLWFVRHWLAIVNLGALLYVGVPFLAPVLMHAGAEPPARAIYALYRPLCHQLPFRSWYLFGEQPAYTYDQLRQMVGEEALVPHGYVGDPELGYKVALCQRDVAIYGTILLAGLAFGLSRRRWRPLPLWAYLAFGVVPIAVDGGAQILSYIVLTLFPTLPLPPLESTPLRRTATGFLFGLSTVWLAYPRLQETAEEVRAALEGKGRAADRLTGGRFSL